MRICSVELPLINSYDSVDLFSGAVTMLVIQVMTMGERIHINGKTKAGQTVQEQGYRTDQTEPEKLRMVRGSEV